MFEEDCCFDSGYLDFPRCDDTPQIDNNDISHRRHSMFNFNDFMHKKETVEDQEEEHPGFAFAPCNLDRLRSKYLLQDMGPKSTANTSGDDDKGNWHIEGEKQKRPFGNIELPLTCREVQGESRRKFLLQFDSESNETSNNPCLVQERERCKSFWNFVASDPQLLAQVQSHTGTPIINSLLEAQPTSQKVQDMEEKELQYCNKARAELKSKNQAMHNAERQRLLLAREKNKELQIKSGQKLTYGNKKADKPNNTVTFAEQRTQNEVFEEMRKYDEISNYPVRSRE